MPEKGSARERMKALAAVFSKRRDEAEDPEAADEERTAPGGGDDG